MQANICNFEQLKEEFQNIKDGSLSFRDLANILDLKTVVSDYDKAVNLVFPNEEVKELDQEAAENRAKARRKLIKCAVKECLKSAVELVDSCLKDGSITELKRLKFKFFVLNKLSPSLRDSKTLSMFFGVDDSYFGLNGISNEQDKLAYLYSEISKDIKNEE